MMIEQFRQTGYKTEVTELTAEALVAAQYATAWEGAEIVEEASMVERRPDRPGYSPLPYIAGAFKGNFKGTFEPRPSGVDATAPDWYALCLASGATITGDVATWGNANVSNSSVLGTACTIKTRDGAYERVLTGARVSKLRFFAEKGGSWKCETEASGRYSESAQTAFVASANPSAGIAHPFLGMACTVGGSAAVIGSAEISIEGQVTPVVDGTHASGYGRNIITDQKLFCRLTILEDGTRDWRDKYRGDAAGDALAISLAMATGAAGNVLTWTGNITLTNKPTVSYVDGIGYWSIEGEFFTLSDSAALTLTQT